MIKFTQKRLGMTHFRTCVAAALLAVTAPTAVEAAVVQSIRGSMLLSVTASAVDFGDLPSVDEDAGGSGFIGAPPGSLSADAAANVTTASGRDSASISVAANSSWISPDQGTINFSALLALYHDGYENTAYARYAQTSEAFWEYQFVANTDAIFTFTALNISRPGNDLNYTFSVFDGNDLKCIVDLSDHGDLCSLDLTAGTEHDFNVRPADLLQSRTVTGETPVDDSTFLLTEFAFDIVAVSTPPADGGNTGALPEPSNWALMIAGFGLVGAALRRRAVRLRVVFT